MVMIIIHHMIVHALGYSSFRNNTLDNLLIPESQFICSTFINFLTIGSVNCFVLISGYFGIRPTSSKIKFLIYSLLFYTIIFNILPSLIEGAYLKAFINCLFLSHSPYWFVVDYLFLMIFTPIINSYFSLHNKNQITTIIIFLIILSCYFGFIWGNPVNSNGYTLIQFILMYSIGRWISIWNFSLKKSYSIIIYIFSCILCTFAAYCLFNFDKIQFVWRITYYNNPLVILSSVSLFLWFKDFDYHNAIINNISRSSLSIYLIQSSSLVSTYMYKCIRNYVQTGSWGNIWFHIILISLIVAIFSIVFDRIRLILFKHFRLI